MGKEYRNVTRTKKMIRMALTELLEERRDIEQITVSELCERADIAKSTFYYHYDDIYAVAEEFENEIVGNLFALLNDMEATGSREYAVYVRRVVEFLTENEDIYKKVLGSSVTRLFLDRLKNLITKKLFTESTVLPFSANPQVRIVQVRFLVNACVDIVVDYFRGVLELSLDEVGAVVLQMLNRLTQ